MADEAPRAGRSRSPERLRAWVGGISLLFAGTLAGLLMAEVGLRMVGQAPPPSLFTVTEAEFRRIPGTFAPGQRAVSAEGTEFEHVTTINSLGYRGADFDLVKPPGELRVLFAGDSFTWGHNVQDDETTPARLEATLRRRCGPAVVVNAGFSGTSILAHQAIIARGLAVAPDVVVLMYHENDIDELVHTRMWEQLAANRRAKSSFPVSVVYPVVRNSALWNLALHARRLLLSRGADAGRSEAAPGESPGVEEARKEYRERLESVRDDLRERGVLLLFVMYPHPESVAAGSGGRDYDWIRDAAAELAVPTLDLLDPLEAGPLTVEEAYLVPLDYHPSAAGHAFAAGVVSDALFSRFDLGKCIS